MQPPMKPKTARHGPASPDVVLIATIARYWRRIGVLQADVNRLRILLLVLSPVGSLIVLQSTHPRPFGHKPDPAVWPCAVARWARPMLASAPGCECVPTSLWRDSPMPEQTAGGRRILRSVLNIERNFGLPNGAPWPQFSVSVNNTVPITCYA
jgi:hypothetical protein